MKIVTNIIFLIIAIVIISTVESKMSMDQLRNTLKSIKNSCSRKIVVDPELVKDMNSGIFTPDKSLMCFVRCILQMMKIIKEGEINLPVLLTQIDIIIPDEYQDRFKNMATSCYSIASEIEESCETSYIFMKCYYETEPDLFFLPP